MTSIANTHNQATPASASQAPTAPSAVVAAPVSSALPAATGAAAVGAINAQADESSMMYFVTSGLTLLYKHSSRKHSRLRQECVDILAKLKSLEKARSEQPAPHPPLPNDANDYYLPFKLACDTGQDRLVAIALDCIQKLMAYGYLDGNCWVSEETYPSKKAPLPSSSPTTSKPDAKESQAAAATIQNTNLPSPTPMEEAKTQATQQPQQPTKRKLIHVIIETMYECSMYRDPHVQLQVIKAILTAVSSVSSQIHDHSLLQAVTSCYQIFLQSTDDNNRTTSKAALTQIFNLVFQRMEHFAAQLKQLEDTAQQQAKLANNNNHSPSSGGHDGNAQSQQPQSSQSPPSTPSSHSALTDVSGDGLPLERILSDSDAVLATAVEPTVNNADDDSSSSPSHTPESLSISVQSSVDTTPPKHPPGKRGYCIVCRKPANHICLQTKDPVCGMECKLINLQKKDPQRSLALSVRNKIASKLQILQNDAYYLLRALVRLSHKSLSQPPEQAAVDSKVLSLQLLLSVMNGAGPTFTHHKLFVNLVKGDLVNCLLRNSAASNIEVIFSLSSSIFVALLQHFRPHLHKVIGPFIDSIYLPYIQSPNSTFEHKYTSLNVLRSICQDPALILELFLNYDCDLGSFNTFQKIADTLEKICQGAFLSPDHPMPEQDAYKLRLIALESLSAILKSLASWTERFPNTAAQQAQQSIQSVVDHAGNNIASRTSAFASVGAAAAVEALQTPVSTTSMERSPSVHEDLSAAGNPETSPEPSSANSGQGEASARGVSLASSFSAQFHLLRQQKQKLDVGISKLNAKAKVGIAYLQQHGLLGNNPEDIAAFFHKNPNLDKVQVGDYMGDENDFNKKVLYAYVEQMDFHGQSFDEAIRAFVQGFRLPGEAQKIDRMMEKFAEQFHKHNPSIFHSADTAYVLAYSIILLNTDAHSPMVKNRMTKEDFFKNCRGIDDGKDIDPVFLGDIYDRIVNNEIKMKDDPLGPNEFTARKQAKPINPSNRFNLFVKESQGLVEKTRDLIKNKMKVPGKLSQADKRYVDDVAQNEQPLEEQTDAANTNGSDADAQKRDVKRAAEKSFYLATDADAMAIRPMFEIVWYSSLATLSVLLEESEDERVIQFCLDGYRAAIKIANALEFQTSRLAFISSLRKFTLLDSATKEMKPKNIQATLSLLLIACTEGNYLGDSWVELLSSISEIERLHLIANTRSSALQDPSKPSDTINSQQMHLIDSTAIDRVFQSSAHLNGEAIFDFISALRTVSEQELANTANPRVFSLQKMVEVTQYNMGRIRVVWSRIWSQLSDFFQRTGCHANPSVSMYAIDSLKQLAMKFLEKDELSSFQFQKQFFKPFEFIMQNNSSVDIRELVVQVLSRMISQRAHNIKSGWKSIFVVLKLAARQPQKTLVESAFQLLSTIMEHNFPLIAETVETTDECVNALVAFGCNAQLTDLNLKAIDYLKVCTNSLSQSTGHRGQLELGSTQPHGKDDVKAGETPTPTVAVNQSPIIHSNAAHGAVPNLNLSSSSHVSHQVTLKVWFLVLTGLSRMIGDSRVEIRSYAIHTLFEILELHGHLFSSSTWRAVFHGVLLPLFDDVRHAHEQKHDGHAVSPAITPKRQQPNSDTDAKDVSAVASSPVSAPAATSVASPPASETPKVVAVAVAAPAMDHGWLHSVLTSLVNLYTHHHQNISYLLPEILQLIHTCIVQESSEELSRIGVRVFIDLIKKIGGMLSIGHWWIVLNAVATSLHHTLPSVLMSDQIRQLLQVPQPPASASNSLSYSPFIKLNHHTALSNKDKPDSSPTAASSSDTPASQPSVAVSGTPSTPGGAAKKFQPIHARAPSVQLPFVTSFVLTRLKIQLWLSEAVSQIVTLYFPDVHVALKNILQAANRSPPPPLHHLVSLTSAAASSTTASGGDGDTSRSSSNVDVNIPLPPPHVLAASELGTISGRVMDLQNPQVLGCLTLAQTLFCVDVLSEFMLFARQFNLDIQLRRKLHTAGFHTPAPPAHATAANTAQSHSRSHTPVQHDNNVQSPAQPPHTLPQPPTATASGSGTASPAAPAGRPARLPQLFYPEAHVLKLCMDILFRFGAIELNMNTSNAEMKQVHESLLSEWQLVSDADNAAIITRFAESRLVSLGTCCINEYVQRTQSGQLVSLECMDEVICALLHNMSSLPAAQFPVFLRHFYLPVTQIMEFGQANIRHQIRNLFEGPVMKLIPSIVHGR